MAKKKKRAKKELVAMREREQKAAGKAVGVEKVIFLRNTNGDLEHTKMEKRIRSRAKDAGKKKGWKYAEAFRRLTF